MARMVKFSSDGFDQWAFAISRHRRVRLLVILCASSNAATVRHSGAHHHIVIRPGWTSSFAAVPGAYAPRRAPVHYDDTPSYNDPSKFGGPTALPIQN